MLCLPRGFPGSAAACCGVAGARGYTPAPPGPPPKHPHPTPYPCRRAVAVDPTDVLSHAGLGRALSESLDHAAACDAYRAALALTPQNPELWLALGLALAPIDGRHGEVVEALQLAVSYGESNLKARLTLGRYYMQLARPAEAIEQFYAAAAIDVDCFEEVVLGVGTARGQQGRLRGALSAFEAASRLNPSNARLREALVAMADNAETVEAAMAGAANAVPDVCGTACQDVVDGAGLRICAISWADGCGDAEPPAGFTVQSTVAELCRWSCAVHVWEAEHKQKSMF